MGGGKETGTKAQERLPFLDVIRGGAVLVMILVHRVHYHWPGMSSREALRAQFFGWQAPVIVLVVIGLTMAGVFYAVSGAAHAVSKHRRVADGGAIGRMVLAGILQGATLMTLNVVYRLFLMNGFAAGQGGAEPKYPIGLITGLVRTGEPVTFRWTQVTAPGTLFLLGAAAILLSVVLGLLLRRGGGARTGRNVAVLAVLAVASLALYAPVAALARPAYDLAYAEGRHGTAFLLGHLTLTFGLLPNLAFVFSGAALGCALAGGVSRADVLRGLKRIGWGAAAAGLCVAAAALAVGIGLRKTSPLTGTLAALSGAGVYLLLLRRGLNCYDYAPLGACDRRLRRYRRLRRLGRLSLTIYLFEPLLAEVLTRSLRGLAGPAWSQGLPAVLLMAVVVVLVWDVLLALWQQVGFAGSTEWILGRVLARVAPCPGGRLDFSDLETSLVPGFGSLELSDLVSAEPEGDG